MTPLRERVRKYGEERRRRAMEKSEPPFYPHRWSDEKLCSSLEHVAKILHRMESPKLALTCDAAAKRMRALLAATTAQGADNRKE